MRRSSLNQTYRLIWSEISNTWVAVAETARAKGKGGRSRIVAGVLLTTLGLLGHDAAWAACPGTVANGETITTTCNLSGNQSVTVDSGGALTNAFNGLNISGSGNTIINSGSITATARGIDTSTTLGVGYSLTNNAGAIISGPSNGIRNFDVTIIDLINNGSIFSSLGTAISNQSFNGTGNTITNLSNGATGLIQGSNGIFNFSGSVITTLTNAGEISTSAAVGVATTAIRNNSGATIGTLTNDGTIRVASGGWAINNQGTITNGIDNTGTLDGMVVLGGATLNLNGASGRVTGAVTGSSGATVNINGTFTTENTFNVGIFAINSGGTLNQAHSITASTAFVNSGTLAVADGVTANITGNYTQNGVLSIGASSGSSYGKLNVSGTAALNSNASFNVNVATSNTLAAGNTLTGVLTAGSAIANNGSALTVTDNSNLFNFTAAINGNQVDIATVAAGGSSGGSVSDTVLEDVRSQGFHAGEGAARVLDTFVQGGTTGTDFDNVVTALGQLATAQEVSHAVAQTLPLFTAGMNQVSINTLHGTNRVIQARHPGAPGRQSRHVLRRRVSGRPQVLAEAGRLPGASG